MKKKKHFHEQFGRNEDHVLPSEKSFSYVMSGAFFIIAGLIWWYHPERLAISIILITLCVMFLLTGIVKPLWLRPLNKAWMKLGFLLFQITNPIVMMLIYVITILPIGLIIKMMGKDPLHRKLDNTSTTYWITREIPGPPPETMKRQF